MIRRLSVAALIGAATLLASAQVAWACGFLVAPNGAVRLVRTTTFVAWDGDIERYVTNFEFQSDQESFGSIIPLPGRPTHVGKAGDWTLQRLVREVEPPQTRAFAELAAAAAEGDVEIVLETQVESLDITVVHGGGAEVAAWADAQGFDLGEGAAQLLSYYGDRSPYFMAARFDAGRAADDGFGGGDGVPVLIEMPVERPWVPIHILGFDLPADAAVVADVFLLTPDRPDLLHGLGLTVNRSAPASRTLLDDLRSDENMEWVPDHGWLTHLRLDATAGQLTYDLSVGTAGVDPSPYEAGLTRFELSGDDLHAFGLTGEATPTPWPSLAAAALACCVVGGWLGFALRASDISAPRS